MKSSTYLLCKKVMERGKYSTEEMKIKLDTFLLNYRLTQEEYNELMVKIK